MGEEPSSWEMLAAMAVAVVFRACVGLHGYSGEAAPPMYGDFEAQRHWMEVTVNLPPSGWYVHSADNDMQYWGLDYPPLSAHFSWLVGQSARMFSHPQLVELHRSRGIETMATRAFMRNSVIVSDVVLFFPVALLCARACSRGRHRQLGFLVQLLGLPAFMLIDHGHFQYNCVSLGLTLWAMYFCLIGRPVAASVAFSLALNFKQMSLYLAPGFFCYLLAGCLRAATFRAKAVNVAKLGTAVIATFVVCWLPFLSDMSSMLTVLRRVFPIERHLFEDKVANIWCTLSLLPGLKLKTMMPIPSLVRMTLLATLGAILPPCALLLRRPSRLGFVLCTTACGLAFFLCSYQVHEKHILLPLLPASLLASRQPLLFCWLSTAASFSLFPLLKRDGQALPYFLLQLSYLWAGFQLQRELDGRPIYKEWTFLGRCGLMTSLGAMLALHLAEATLAPPERYPDLHAVAFAAWACAHFVCAYFGILYCQWRVSLVEQSHTPFDASDKGAHSLFWWDTHAKPKVH